jgi:hypothetical protein
MLIVEILHCAFRSLLYFGLVLQFTRWSYDIGMVVQVIFYQTLMHQQIAIRTNSLIAKYQCLH